MRQSLTAITMCFTALLASVTISDAAWAKEDWTVRGSVFVAHQMPDMRVRIAQESPLVGIQVKVSARAKVAGVWGTWNSWGVVRTDAQGRYSVSKNKGSGKRQFKVEVKFDSDKLEIRHETSTASATKVKWYEISHDGQDYDPGVIDLGKDVFRAGATLALDDAEPRAHAEIWVVANLAIDKVASLGSEYAFKNKVKIKYPHNSEVISDNVESSYCNPVTRVVYIFQSNDGQRDHFNTDTIWHEMAHVWAYDHCSGELGLAWQLFADGSTHDDQEKPFVAFHEGFADHFAENMKEQILNLSQPKPFNRDHLKSLGLTNLTKLERRDTGWTHVFRALQLEDIHTYDFNATPGSSVRSADPSTYQGKFSQVRPLTFKNTLTIFLADPGAGHPKDINKDEMTIHAFLHRAADILKKFDSDRVDDWKDVLDPSKTTQPVDVFTNGLKVQGNFTPRKRQ